MATTSATRCGCASWASGARLQQGGVRHVCLQQDERHRAGDRIVGGYPLYTRFGNTSALDIEGGVRYYFRPEGPTRTYVAGVGGVRFHDRVGATIRVLELGLTLTDLDYFEQSTLFIFGADTGISRDLSDTIAIGAEVGLRYQPKLSPAPILSGTGLEASTTPVAGGVAHQRLPHMAILMSASNLTSRRSHRVRAGWMAGCSCWRRSRRRPRRSVPSSAPTRDRTPPPSAAVREREQRRAEGAARRVEGTGCAGA